MKKVIIILSTLLILFGCSKKDDGKRYEQMNLETYKCDMSLYESMSSTEHQFEGINVAQLKRVFDEKGNALIVFSYTDCPHCQKIIKYINEIAKELNVTVYYLDAYSKKYPIVGTDDYQILFDLCEPILEKDSETNKKVLQTPMLFSIINGEHYDHMIGGSLSDPPTETEINKLKEQIKEIILPFSK